jgi:hypothetical protein
MSSTFKTEKYGKYLSVSPRILQDFLNLFFQSKDLGHSL